MAYNQTKDEKKFGSAAGDITADAPSNFNTKESLLPSHTLAEGKAGYGATKPLVRPYLWTESDKDVYNLGILEPGNYELDVDLYTWDFANVDNNASLSMFGIAHSYLVGIPVGFKTNTSENIIFNVPTPLNEFFVNEYYAYVTGNTTSTAQYKIKYEKYNGSIQRF